MTDPGRAQHRVTVQGTVRQALPNAMYSVELDGGQNVIGHVSGDMRTRTIRVLPGDRVTVELSPYDPTRGRIVGKSR